MKDERYIIAEQFANDWLLVAMNDYDTYTSLMEQAEKYESVSAFADQLQKGWEYLAHQVCEVVEENISPVAGLFIAQTLQGLGSLPFDLIAREIIATKKEQEAVNV